MTERRLPAGGPTRPKRTKPAVATRIAIAGLSASTGFGLVAAMEAASAGGDVTFVTAPADTTPPGPTTVPEALPSPSAPSRIVRVVVVATPPTAATAAPSAARPSRPAPSRSESTPTPAAPPAPAPAPTTVSRSS